MLNNGSQLSYFGGEKIRKTLLMLSFLRFFIFFLSLFSRVFLCVGGAPVTCLGLRAWNVHPPPNLCWKRASKRCADACIFLIMKSEKLQSNAIFFCYKNIPNTFMGLVVA